ncbi:LysE/ArgO family amino acid transporter [Falsigemmobacter faecalis]|uniref:Amino acid transporter n=1 Tax=Falsigemmobacter faecalis TaxID=2488730 RepID=A0A3P3DSI5_9RHOB|nr:LysE/ArgO family amino acid transporter [Falsigemmobacter faecalis]RRH77253.1 amino acid transporter [Falsigemmobacter faecalis]
MLQALLAGFATSFGLIAAIGAQNAFVLRQGLRREHVGPVVAICALSDALLIAAGVGGFGALVRATPWLGPLMMWLGAVFLFYYGSLRFRAALKGGAALMPAEGQSVPLGKTIATCLLFTWANPHVYLDTVVLLGGLSAQYAPFQWVFGLAGAAASVIFFSALGFGARLMAPLFAQPKAWVVLEGVVGCTMWLIALSLVLRGL